MTDFTLLATAIGLGASHLVRVRLTPTASSRPAKQAVKRNVELVQKTRQLVRILGTRWQHPPKPERVWEIGRG